MGNLSSVAEALAQAAKALNEAISVIQEMEKEELESELDPNEVVERVAVKEVVSGRVHMMPITRRQKKIRDEEDKGPRHFNIRKYPNLGDALTGP